MRHIQSLRIRKQVKASVAGLVKVQSDVVPPGELWHIRRFSYESSSATSGGNTRARAVIDADGFTTQIAEQFNPSADTLYVDDQEFDMIEGERLVIESDQAQASALLKLSAIGYRLTLGPETESPLETPLSGTVYGATRNFP